MSGVAGSLLKLSLLDQIRDNIGEALFAKVAFEALGHQRATGGLQDLDVMFDDRRPFVVGLLQGGGGSGGATSSSAVRVSILSPPDVVAAGPYLTPDGKTVLFAGIREDLDRSEPEPASG